jgi:hypothetical protein
MSKTTQTLNKLATAKALARQQQKAQEKKDDVARSLRESNDKTKQMKKELAMIAYQEIQRVVRNFDAQTDEKMTAQVKKVLDTVSVDVSDLFHAVGLNPIYFSSATVDEPKIYSLTANTPIPVTRVAVDNTIHLITQNGEASADCKVPVGYRVMAVNDEQKIDEMERLLKANNTSVKIHLAPLSDSILEGYIGQRTTAPCGTIITCDITSVPNRMHRHGLTCKMALAANFTGHFNKCTMCPHAIRFHPVCNAEFVNKPVKSEYAYIRDIDLCPECRPCMYCGGDARTKTSPHCFKTEYHGKTCTGLMCDASCTKDHPPATTEFNVIGAGTRDATFNYAVSQDNNGHRFNMYEGGISIAFLTPSSDEQDGYYKVMIPCIVDSVHYFTYVRLNTVNIPQIVTALHRFAESTVTRTESAMYFQQVAIQKHMSPAKCTNKCNVCKVNYEAMNPNTICEGDNNGFTIYAYEAQAPVVQFTRPESRTTTIDPNDPAFIKNIFGPN